MLKSFVNTRRDKIVALKFIKRVMNATMTEIGNQDLQEIGRFELRSPKRRDRVVGIIEA